MQYCKNRFSSQNGSTMLMVAVAVVVIFGFLILAVDMPMVMLTKTQLQNAADAAALAGAIAYEQSNPHDPTVARGEAILIAGLNNANQDDARRPVNISAADVTIDAGDTVWVTTHRTHATDDPLRQHFLKFVNPTSDNLTDVTAHAAARVSPICGTDCLKPWCIPDRWRDMPIGATDSLWDPGLDYYDPFATGYSSNTDVGTSILIKHDSHFGNGQFRSGWFGPVCFPPVNRGNPISGANIYRQYIAECEPYEVRVGDTLRIETGNMVGPTNQGIANLIALDPNARWDGVSGTVINSAFPTSPRCILVPCFDPRNGAIDGRYLEIIKIVVVFIESQEGNGTVRGKFMRMAVEGDPCDPDSSGGFVYKPSLVR